MKRYLLYSLLVPILSITGNLSACGNTGNTSEQENKMNTAIREFPFEITSNKPWVQGRINDSEPLWFILDTGSAETSVIAYTRAKELGLTLENETEMHIGAGEGVLIKAAQVKGVNYDIHGELLTDQACMAASLDHVAVAEGRRFDGTLGRNFIERYVVEIDYPNELIRLYEPATYEYTGTGRSIPFMLFYGFPVAQAIVKVPGEPMPVIGNFIIDTGTRMAILFNTPFTDMHNVRGSGMNLLEGTVGIGVGGEVEGFVGRLESMRLGPFFVKEPVAVFSQDKSGVVASNAFDGIIGGELLRRSKVIFDYSRERMILEPVSGTPHPFEYDMSGLFLIAKGADFSEFTVISVMAGSPAAEAGMETGDILTAIDGLPATGFTLEEIRGMFMEDGREVVLDIMRGEVELQIEFKTSRLV